MRYNKLVRDKIPTHIKKRGGEPTYHTATEIEYWNKLKEKLIEECEEFVATETIEELADIQEVLAAIRAYKQFTASDVEVAQAKKAADRGVFTQRIILDEA